MQRNPNHREVRKLPHWQKSKGIRRADSLGTARESCCWCKAALTVTGAVNKATLKSFSVTKRDS